MAQVRGDCRSNVCPLQQARAGLDLPREARVRLANAYAEQSRSDFTVYAVHLKDAEECHRLHYLQMACEKIAKAYRLRDTKTFGLDDLYSHTVFSRFIQNFLRVEEVTDRYQAQNAKLRQIERFARSLAAEIEKLAPAVDRDLTPANAEYPWEDGGAVSVPCRHRYAIVPLLAAPGGRDFLKLIETAIMEYDTITLTG